MKQLMYSDIYSWSIFSEMRQLDFNGHLWIRSEGNVLIDPVPMVDSDLNQLAALGGAELIVITNCDHEREAEKFRALTGAQIAVHEADAGAMSTKVDRSLADGEEIVPGLTAIHLRYGKSAGEIALYFSEREIVLAGDLIVGAPIGNLSLLADEKLEDPANAALEIRKILALSFDTILVGDGHSILRDGRRQLVECLERHKDIYINRINISEIEWEKRDVPPPYDFMDKDIDRLIGARSLGLSTHTIGTRQRELSDALAQLRRGDVLRHGGKVHIKNSARQPDGHTGRFRCISTRAGRERTNL